MAKMNFKEISWKIEGKKVLLPEGGKYPLMMIRGRMDFVRFDWSNHPELQEGNDSKYCLLINDEELYPCAVILNEPDTATKLSLNVPLRPDESIDRAIEEIDASILNSDYFHDEEKLKNMRQMCERWLRVLKETEESMYEVWLEALAEPEDEDEFEPTEVAFLQKWIESERGWGQRPDGYSLHKSLEDRKAYIKAYNDGMPDKVPDEYSRPSEEPVTVLVSSHLLSQIEGTGKRISKLYKDIKIPE